MAKNPRTYKNPFHLENQWEGCQLGDPFIMRFDGRYYLYCSSHKAQIKCWMSEDLVEWDYCGSVCDLPEVENAYAPEVCYTRGKFYMVTSPKGSGHYLLSSNAPTGPFVFETENFGLMIDGSIFVDDDGSEYFLRAGKRGIEAHSFLPPGAPETVGTVIPQSFLNWWTEGPLIIKRDGYYYLTMTGNHLLSRGYRVDYCVSPDSPAHGYIVPRNKTLLLEVGDEFHALGHSSTVLGPDMDSYFIAYHSFDFTASPPYRSLNIDRLFFNGARMYVNASWWEQAVPARPVFASRGGEGMKTLEVDGRCYYTTPAAGASFSAELNINPRGKDVVVLVGIDTDKPAALEISSKGVKLRNIERPLQPNVDLAANVTVRISYAEKDYLHCYINGMLSIVLCGDSPDFPPPEGQLGLWSEAGGAPGFIGVSAVSGGSGDYAASKNIPGKFSAVHSTSDVLRAPIDNNGLPAFTAKCRKSDVFKYRVNVKENGSYSVFLRLKCNPGDASQKDVSLKVNGEYFALTDLPPGRFITVYAGDITLAAGESELCISDMHGIELLDEIEIIKSAGPTGRIMLIGSGKLQNNALRIMGHKKEHSMLRKEWGFTCAENHGMGFFGEDGWTDYSIKAEMNINRSTDGSLSIFLRATGESWYPHQAMPSLLGYRVLVNHEYVSLLRCHYGEEELARLALPGDCGNSVPFDISVKGGRITVCTESGSINYTDFDCYAYGKIGIEATNEGYGFESLEIEIYK